MALIVKGKMPTCCGLCCECLGGGSDAYYCNRAKRQISEVVPPYDKRMKWCPIIGEIPDNHGRLIDADKLLPESGYDPMMFQPKYGGDHRTQYNTLMGYEILGMVDDAPTVLEASR